VVPGENTPLLYRKVDQVQDKRPAKDSGKSLPNRG